MIKVFDRTEFYDTNLQKLISIQIKNTEGYFKIEKTRVIKLNHISKMDKAAQENFLKSEKFDFLQYPKKYTLLESSTKKTEVPCYYVMEEFPDEFIDFLRRKYSGNTPNFLVKKKIYFISKKDYFMYGEDNYNVEGALINSLMYRDVLLNVPISEDLFQIPKNRKIEIANSAFEEIVPPSQRSEFEKKKQQGEKMKKRSLI